MNYLEFKAAMQEAEEKMNALDVDVDECDVFIYSREGKPVRIVLKRTITNTVDIQVAMNE